MTHAYRTALDGYRDSGFDVQYQLPEWVKDEVYKVSHRPYGTGFYFGDPSQNTKSGGYIREYQAVAVVTGYENGQLLLSQRNRFFKGDTLEALIPFESPVTFTADNLFDEDGNAIDAAPHPTMSLRIPYDHPLPIGTYLRKRL